LRVVVRSYAQVGGVVTDFPPKDGRLRPGSADAVSLSRFNNLSHDTIIQIRISTGKRLPRHRRIFLGAFLACNPWIKHSAPLELS